MSAPSITWYRITGTTSGPTYSMISSLDFGTVTAGQWSNVQCIRPKIAVNSIQSAEWWMNDVGGVRSAVSTAMGTAGSWVHRMTVVGFYVKPSGLTASNSWGTEVPESTGSGYAYSATSDAVYGDFVYFAVKVPSAAGDGAHTAWGYQLKYSYT